MTCVQGELALGWSPDHPEHYRHAMGRACRVTVQVPFWSDDWHDGMRSRTYVGTVCSHHSGGFCLQPPAREQGIALDRGLCFRLTPEMIIEVLPGKDKDYP